MMVCKSRSGYLREHHTWDKDGRCVFCDHISEGVPAEDLWPAMLEERTLGKRLRGAELSAAEHSIGAVVQLRGRDSRLPHRDVTRKMFTEQDKQLLADLKKEEEGE